MSFGTKSYGRKFSPHGLYNVILEVISGSRKCIEIPYYYTSPSLRARAVPTKRPGAIRAREFFSSPRCDDFSSLLPIKSLLEKKKNLYDLCLWVDICMIKSETVK